MSIGMVSKAKSRPTMYAAIYMGSRMGNDPEFAKQSGILAKGLCEKGIGIVYGGSDCGLMKVVADSALEVGGDVVGVFPDDMPTEWIHKGLTETIRTKNMAERKELMTKKANFIISLPGGPGTLDELSEEIVSKKLKYHSKPIYLLNVNGYWEKFNEFMKHVECCGFMDGWGEFDYKMFATGEEIVEDIVKSIGEA